MEIAQGHFNYAKHFPSSSKAKGYSSGSLQTVARRWIPSSNPLKDVGPIARCVDYQSAIDHHLKPAFGEKLLTEITAEDIKDG